MKEKKRKSIIVYWIWMVILFVMVLLSQQVVASIMQGNLSSAKYGAEATFEILWSGLVLLIVLLFKNKYIFTQKMEGFFASLKYILPELLLSGFFCLIGLLNIFTSGNPASLASVFNLALYCLFIGIVEEFLCRGWLLNEFLERYSNNKKEIILSIIFSSLIFGVIHFINVGETQSFIETCVQVMNAAAGGVFLALVYYKTKNIWVVVASHAIWDFSIFLSDVSSLGDCLSGTATSFGIVMNIIRGLVLIIAYSFFSYWLYRQTDLYQKEVKNTKDYYMAIGVALYIVGLLFLYVPEEGTLCPEYTRRKIDNPYQVIYSHSLEYHIENTPLSLGYDEESGRVTFQNTVGKYEVFLTEEDDKVYDYLLIENDDYYSILIQTSYNVVYYGNYSKNNIIGTKEYLEKVKKSLVKTVGPDISRLGILKIEGNLYQYPMLVSSLGDYLYFDRDGKLYINQEG